MSRARTRSGSSPIAISPRPPSTQHNVSSKYLTGLGSPPIRARRIYSILHALSAVLRAGSYYSVRRGRSWQSLTEATPVQGSDGKSWPTVSRVGARTDLWEVAPKPSLQKGRSNLPSSVPPCLSIWC